MFIHIFTAIYPECQLLTTHTCTLTVFCFQSSRFEFVGRDFSFFSFQYTAPIKSVINGVRLAM